MVTACYNMNAQESNISVEKHVFLVLVVWSVNGTDKDVPEKALARPFITWYTLT